MKYQHKTLNIEFSSYTKDQLYNLNETQAEALATHFTSLSKRLAESEFLVSAYENGWDVPNIDDNYKGEEK